MGVRKRKKPAWSVKQGFTPNHQRIRNHMDSSEDDEQTENYHNFFNFSILNEARLSAAIARIDQFFQQPNPNRKKMKNAIWLNLRRPSMARTYWIIFDCLICQVTETLSDSREN